MQKEFLVKELEKLIQSRKLWNEMEERISAFGGELSETKFADAYNFYEELIFNLIVQYRNFEEGEYEFEFFQDAIYELSKFEECEVDGYPLYSAGDLYNALIASN